MKNILRKICFIIYCFFAVRAMGAIHIGILGDRTGDANEKIFEEVVDQMQKLGPDMVINVGDLIEGPQPDVSSINDEWDQILPVLGKIKCPKYFVPGNNDIFDSNSRAQFTERTGFKAFYSFDFKKIHFVVLDNSEARSIEEMGVEQINWLEEDLKLNLDAPLTCVFFHKPFWFVDFISNKENLLHELFKKYGVDWVFSGHFHSFVRTEKDGIKYVMVGSSGGRIGGVEEAGNFYHFGWLTVTEEDSFFSLFPLDALKRSEFLTMETRQKQDQIENEFLTIKPVILDGNMHGEVKFSMKNLEGFSLPLNGQYHLEESDGNWKVSNCYFKYEFDKKNSINFTESIDLIGTLYPLPLLKIDTTPFKDFGYPVERRVPVCQVKTIPFVEKLPRIDGVIQENQKPILPIISELGKQNGEIGCVEKTIVNASYNQKGICFSGVISESKMDQLKTMGKKQDDPVFQADCIYLLIWDVSGSIPELFQIIMNPDGIIMDSKASLEDVTTRPKFSVDWNSKAKLKVQKMNDHWTFEIRILWKNISKSILENKSFRFNFIRYQSRLNEMGIWNYPATYNPEDAGILKLGSVE